MSKPVGKSAASKSLSVRRPAATKTAGKKAANATPREAATPAPARGAKNILTAGIKALTNAHEEAVARQSRVFESLLGLGPKRDAGSANDKSPSSLAASALDPFGFKKFEDVFDQRVARAMENLGVPSAQAMADLTAEVERLRETVARLEAQGRKR